MQNIKLKLEEGTGKILEYTATDEEGITCIPDSYEPVIDTALKQGYYVYYKDGVISKREKDKPQYAEKIHKIDSQLQELGQESKFRLARFINSKTDKSALDIKKIMLRRNEIMKERENLQNGFANDSRCRMYEAIKSNEFKYYCSICLIIRDENEYLEEWLRWHILQGIQHFYIYDHGSKQPVSQFINTLDSEIREKVTVNDFSGTHIFAQHDAYNDCLEKYKYESRWIGFIDSDEMVRIKNGKTMPQFLKSYELYAGLFIVWEMYGANGQVKKSTQPLRTRFTKISPSGKSDGVGKVFVQPLLIKKMLTHNGYPVEGCCVVDEYKCPVDDAEAWKYKTTKDMICLDHYYTKSYEEWVEKIKRGSADPQYFRYYEEFFDYNPDMEYCREDIFPEQEYEISKK